MKDSLLVRDVINEGIEAFNLGVPFDHCPYETNNYTHLIEYDLEANPTGEFIRIDIDYREIWESGWNLGELIAERSEARIAVGT